MIKILICILIIFIAIYFLNYIAYGILILFFVGISCSILKWFILYIEDLFKDRKKVKNNKNTDSVEKHNIRKIKRKMSEYELERFMIECNAYLEHKDEMEQYEDVNGINEKNKNTS